MLINDSHFFDLPWLNDDDFPYGVSGTIARIPLTEDEPLVVEVNGALYLDDPVNWGLIWTEIH